MENSRKNRFGIAMLTVMAIGGLLSTCSPSAMAADGAKLKREIYFCAFCKVGQSTRVAGLIAVSPTDDTGAINIALPSGGIDGRGWSSGLDLSKVFDHEKLEQLRKQCEPDLPCAGHFTFTVVEIRNDTPEKARDGERRVGDNLCPIRPTPNNNRCRYSPGSTHMIATFDDFN